MHMVIVLDVLILCLYNLYKVHLSFGLTSDFFMCRYCALTTYSTLEGSLMPMSSHYPSTVTTL